MRPRVSVGIDKQQCKRNALDAQAIALKKSIALELIPLDRVGGRGMVGGVPHRGHKVT